VENLWARGWGNVEVGSVDGASEESATCSPIGRTGSCVLSSPMVLCLFIRRHSHPNTTPKMESSCSPEMSVAQLASTRHQYPQRDQHEHMITLIHLILHSNFTQHNFNVEAENQE
jgi:hypothetical protein